MTYASREVYDTADDPTLTHAYPGRPKPGDYCRLRGALGQPLDFALLGRVLSALEHASASVVFPDKGGGWTGGRCVTVPIADLDWWGCPAGHNTPGGRALPKRPDNWQALATSAPTAIPYSELPEGARARIVGSWRGETVVGGRSRIAPDTLVDPLAEDAP
jgi:hypothetical protein